MCFVHLTFTDHVDQDLSFFTHVSVVQREDSVMLVFVCLISWNLLPSCSVFGSSCQLDLHFPGEYLVSGQFILLLDFFCMFSMLSWVVMIVKLF